jgi:hypothetical protein
MGYVFPRPLPVMQSHCHTTSTSDPIAKNPTVTTARNDSRTRGSAFMPCGWRSVAVRYESINGSDRPLVCKISPIAVRPLRVEPESERISCKDSAVFARLGPMASMDPAIAALVDSIK